MASGHGEGTLGPHGQVLHREPGVVVGLEETVCKLPEPTRSGFVRAVDVGAVNEGSQAVKLFPGAG